VKKKVDKYYAYHEVAGDNGVIEFGWIISDSIDESQNYVLSYPSKSKRVSEKDAVWSREEGCSATTVADYSTYIEKLVGQSPADFLSEWVDNIEAYPLVQGWREETPSFLINLCNLVVGNTNSFTQFGRIYKRVNVEE